MEDPLLRRERRVDGDPAEREIVAGQVLFGDRESMQLLWAGTSGGEFGQESQGVFPALYYFGVLYAFEKGYRQADYCGSRPLLSDGIFQLKRRWGGHVYDGWSRDTLFFLPIRLEQATLGFLTRHPLIARCGNDLVGKVLSRHRTHPARRCCACRTGLCDRRSARDQAVLVAAAESGSTRCGERNTGDRTRGLELRVGSRGGLLQALTGHADSLPRLEGAAPDGIPHSSQQVRLVAVRCRDHAGLAHVAGAVASHVFHHEHVFGLVDTFDMNFENNVPTFLSAFMLVATAVLLTVIASQSTADRYAGYWKWLAIIFTFMAIDEDASLHELLIEPVRDLLAVTGPLYFAWIIPYALAVLVIGLLYLKFVWSLPARTRGLFIGCRQPLPRRCPRIRVHRRVVLFAAWGNRRPAVLAARRSRRIPRDVRDHPLHLRLAGLPA